MKPAPFDLLLPEDTGEALAALAEEGEGAKVMAGGQSLMPMLNMRLVQPSLLIDIARLPDLKRIEAASGWLTVGAAVTQAELLARPSLAQEVPLLAAMLPWVGHYQTRNRGTVCGSVAHGDPSAELPLALIALDGEVLLRSRSKRRSVAARDFYLGPLASVRADDELVEAVRFPLEKSARGFAFREMSQRHGDFAIVGLAALSEGNKVRLAVGGMGDKPAARDWDGLDEGEMDDALNELAWELKGDDDHHASARYRRELVRRLGRKVIVEARACHA